MEDVDINQLEKEVSELRATVSDNSRKIIELSNKSTHVFCKKSDMEKLVNYYTAQNIKLKRFNEDQKIISERNKEDFPLNKEKRLAHFNKSLQICVENNSELTALENTLEELKNTIKKMKNQIIEKEKRFSIIEENKILEGKINELKLKSRDLLSRQEELLNEQKDLKIKIESLQRKLRYPLKNISSSYDTLLQLVTNETKKNISAEFNLRNAILDSITEIENATHI